ncbi:MAG: hypothetical protein ACRD6X_11770 [Pyrinomonadaceae bacterium]
MKKALFIAIFSLCLSSVGHFAQKPLRQWPYEDLSAFMGEYNKRRNGERLIVRAVPAVDKIRYEKSNSMYSFAPNDTMDVTTTFYTSAALAKALRLHLKTKTDSMWVTCTLIQFDSGSDYYRSPFATRVEGLDEEGNTIWTVTGPPPAKLKFRH